MASTAPPHSHVVYIVRCADGTFYTGYATDPRQRVHVHNAGRGARYTRGRGPVRLVYTEFCASRGEALSREHAIKQLTRDGKRRLIREARRQRMDGCRASPPV
ncbi:MAG: GIY-YIG nuclease family protein [Vicinamibacterales bacterium]